MTAVEMPVVGKSFYTFCKKCDTDRYHTVLALPTETSAKLQCEVCKAKSTWKVPSAKPKSTGPRGAAAKARANSEAAKAAAHNAEYETMSKTLDSAPANKYDMRAKFDKDTKLNHPKFGLGFIRTVQSDKIEVVFQDEVRQLVHNRR